jgi:hypothetical protein
MLWFFKVSVKARGQGRDVMGDHFSRQELFSHFYRITEMSHQLNPPFRTIAAPSGIHASARFSHPWQDMPMRIP